MNLFIDLFLDISSVSKVLFFHFTFEKCLVDHFQFYHPQCHFHSFLLFVSNQLGHFFVKNLCFFRLLKSNVSICFVQFTNFRLICLSQNLIQMILYQHNGIASYLRRIMPVIYHKSFHIYIKLC